MVFILYFNNSNYNFFQARYILLTYFDEAIYKYRNVGLQSYLPNEQEHPDTVIISYENVRNFLTFKFVTKLM